MAELKEPLIVPPEDAPPLRTTEVSDRPSGRELVRILVSAVVVIAILAALVFGGRWVYHKVHHVQPAPATTKNTPAAVPNTSNNSQNNSSPSQAASSSPGTLPNNGPGDVLAIFTVASMAAAGLHFVVSSRKAS